MNLHRAYSDKLAQRSRRGTPDTTDASRSEHAADVPRILVIDDEPEITRSVAAMLDGEYEVITANSAEEGLAALEHMPVAVILTDQRMPGGTGAELLARALDVSPETTRILFTGYSDISAVIDAVNEGQVYRYITKPWQPSELQAVISQGLDRYRLVIENRRLMSELEAANIDLEQRVEERTRRLQEQNQALREARARIEELSRRDPLTGLPNRRWLDEVLNREAARARQQTAVFSVIMRDLDHFKVVNDLFGHSVGDQVLRAAAATLEQAAAITDVVGRYGGEEFLVLLPNARMPQAQATAERMRAALRAIPVTFRPEPITASFGVAQWQPGDTIASFIDRADDALYKAKREGRDRVEQSEQSGRRHD